MFRINKSTYLAAVAAFALTACSNDDDQIFDQSAADRLEQYKNNYEDVLTADGGLWTMEYFSNPDEPGYLFIMKFDKNGSVKIGANHKWIGNTYQEETSLWKMIADNGPVLSFNSYNKLFHIFSDPANITGSDAPKGDNDDDIDETGYGHEGDYEFQVMEVSDDKNTVRLLGKKYLYHIYLRRLDPSTDMKAYMEAYKKIESSLFCKEISNLTLRNLDGEDYVVTGCHTGVMSIYPKDGDAVDQTRKGNFIITDSGIRFREPLVFENAAGEEKTFEEFKFVGNYSLALVGNENVVLNAGSFENIMMNNLRNWKVDLKSLTGDYKIWLDDFNAQLKDLYKYNSASLSDMSFDYDVASKSYVVRLYMRISSRGYETNRFYVTFSDQDGGAVKISIGEAYDNGSALGLNAYPVLQRFFADVNSSTYNVVEASECGPKVITLSSGDDSMIITAQ